MTGIRLAFAAAATSWLALASGQALAQTADEAQAEQEQSGGLDQIVVTARKRTENLQDTPISISALSGAALEERGISNTSDIDNVIPNLTFQSSAAQSGDKSAAQIYIRGVGQTDFTLTTDPGVGLYLDGVYIARSIGSALDTLDVERIEVLRGPQGTLFGRNTIGGAINITSRAPEFDELSGSATVTVGRFDRLDVKAGINVPLGDDLAATASVMRKTSDGYIERPALGDTTGIDDLWAGRFAMRWEPTDRLRVNFAADATLSDEKPCCSELVAIYPGALTGFYNAVTAPAIAAQTGNAPVFFDQSQLPTEEYIDNGTFDRDTRLRLWGVSLTGEYDLTDALTLKSISAYRKFTSVNGGDFDHTPLAINETANFFRNEQFSQEVQLQGTAFDDRLNFIFGAYYFEEDGYNEDAVNFSIIRLVSGGFVDNSSLAFFGQTTFEVTPTISLTTGLRWTRDQRGFTPEQFVVENIAGIPSAVTGQLLQPGDRVVPTTRVSQSIKDATPYVNLSWDAADNLMFYVSYSEGFKSGGFVQRIFPDRVDIPRFLPESVEVWEGGFKFESFDRRLRFNAAVFNTDYQNLQINVFDGIAPVTKNAAAARIRGVEAELTAEPVDDLRINFGLGYLDAKYTEIDPNATEINLNSSLVNAPEWSLNAGISYGIEAGDWTVTPHLDWAHRSTTYNNAANTAALVQDPYSIINAGITVSDFDDKWQISLLGKNLTDKRYIQSGFADEAVQSIAVATFGRPVEWELSVTRRF